MRRVTGYVTVMQVTASLKNLRIAPRKAKLVADLIKGLDTKEAVYQLDFTVKRACPDVKKLLLSAVANGESNFGLSRDNLYVLDAVVGAGPSLKRWMPKAYGRAGKILKRTSNITIVLEERIEGKDRKSKEQLEKEKKARMDEKKKQEKEKEPTEEAEKKETASSAKAVKDKGTDKVKKETPQKSWANKIFRRKSM